MRVSKRFGASRNRSCLLAMESHCHHSRRIRSYRFFAVSLILTALFHSASQAQDLIDVPNPSDALYVVELDDGSLITGRIAEVDAERIVIVLLDGSHQEVERAHISVIRLASEGRIVRGKFWYNDVGNTRLFFTSTGRALRAGEGYLGTYVIVLPFVALGVTDYVTFTAGAPLLVGSIEPMYFGPKVQIIRTAEMQTAVGTLAFYADNEIYGIAYGVSTFGSSDHALTVGIGYGYTGRKFVGEPAFMFGGEWQVSSRTKIITENYYIPGISNPICSIGLRSIGRRANGDLAVALVLDGDGGFSLLPFFGFSVAFGR